LPLDLWQCFYFLAKPNTFQTAVFATSDEVGDLACETCAIAEGLGSTVLKSELFCGL